MTLAGRRYIVCRNREEMKKDTAARAAILAALEQQLQKGDKPGRQQGLPPFPGHARRRPFRHRLGQGGRGRQVRRRLRAQDQRRSLAARSDALLQAIVDGGTGVPHVQEPVRHAADLSQTRRDHSRSRLLQLPRPRAEKRSWRTASPIWASRPPTAPPREAVPGPIFWPTSTR